MGCERLHVLIARDLAERNEAERRDDLVSLQRAPERGRVARNEIAMPRGAAIEEIAIRLVVTIADDPTEIRGDFDLVDAQRSDRKARRWSADIGRHHRLMHGNLEARSAKLVACTDVAR